jgi:hypothetical protein
LIYSAIEKLFKNGFKSTAEYCYRVVNGQLPGDFFVPDETGIVCFCDYGFFSTSRNPVAIEPFYDNKKFHLVIKINQLEKQDILGFRAGVHIAWCSLVEKEEEVLFPPLTLFEVRERKKDKKKVELVVLPTFNF